MKIPRKHILLVESDDNSVEMLRLYLGHANVSSNGRRRLREMFTVGEDRAG